MSEVKVNKISPRTNCGTVQLGDSGDTITIPAGATITNNGTQTGFGRTGTVDWETTPKTANFTAVSGDGFFCNTTSSAFTATLPAGSAGAIVSFADYAGTWQTNNLTVSPDGTDKIGGTNANVILNTEGQSVTFVYVDGTQGWINVQDSTSNERGNEFILATGGTITTCGNDKIHTFTGPGNFTVCAVAACATNNIVSHVVVAGGGGGGSSDHGGGGGAGGYREVKNPVTPYTASPLDGYPSAPNRVTVTATSFPITVGGGGAGGAAPPSPGSGTNGNNGVPGSNSVFSTVTSAGGGRGTTQADRCSPQPLAGGSGGGGNSGCGASPNPSNPGATGGAGNTPPTTPAQGTNGGNGTASSPAYGGGGGGGATVAGTTGTSSAGGAGGTGATSSINGTPTARAGGGGGAALSGSAGAGGTGGGGAGSNGAGSAGTDNTGGGGGGSERSPRSAGGNGGSGIVIIRYKFQ